MKLTLLLIIANILVFAYSIFNPNLINQYGFDTKGFLSGNYYLIATSLFLHANLSHLANNMIALFFLGWTIERNVSKWKYLAAYFGAGFLGDLSVFVPIFGYTDAIAIGASAAISGLVGLGTFVCPSKFVIFPSALPLPFVVAGAIYFLVTLSNIFIPSQVAYPAHLFGAIGGALFGLIWGENRIKRLMVFILLLVLVSNIPLAIGYFL